MVLLSILPLGINHSLYSKQQKLLIYGLVDIIQLHSLNKISGSIICNHMQSQSSPGNNNSGAQVKSHLFLYSNSDDSQQYP